MLLHRDGLIELNYEVTTDILSVKWPELANFSVPEIKHSLTKLVETLKHYDIKKLLIDGRGNHLEVTAEEHKALALQFALDLTTTRLEKVARLTYLDQEMEKQSEAVSAEVKKEVVLPFATEIFFEEPEALQWLKVS